MTAPTVDVESNVNAGEETPDTLSNGAAECCVTTM